MRISGTALVTFFKIVEDEESYLEALKDDPISQRILIDESTLQEIVEITEIRTSNIVTPRY